jgi:hypothetical protein
VHYAGSGVYSANSRWFRWDIQFTNHTCPAEYHISNNNYIYYADWAGPCWWSRRPAPGAAPGILANMLRSARAGSSELSARAAKLADLASRRHSIGRGCRAWQSTGARGGTFAFMARTQIVNYRMARPEVDVWTIAASLYWMLSLAVPRDSRPPQTQSRWCYRASRCRSGTSPILSRRLTGIAYY